MNTKEIWKDIKGFDGLYQVSTFGRVKSLPKNHNNRYSTYKTKEKILKPIDNGNGYLNVCLYKDKKCTRDYIHRLVASTFIGNVPKSYTIVVDHIDNDKSNNCASNLQIITQRMNTSKDKSNGTSKYLGVSKNRGGWQSKIRINGERINLGYFKCELAAAKAYQDKLKSL